MVSGKSAGFLPIVKYCSVNLLRRKGNRKTSGKINVGRTISKRPKEVRKREVIGHWELDTVASS